jgi:hypothetical protein
MGVPYRTLFLRICQLRHDRRCPQIRVESGSWGNALRRTESNRESIGELRRRGTYTSVRMRIDLRGAYLT